MRAKLYDSFILKNIVTRLEAIKHKISPEFFATLKHNARKVQVTRFVYASTQGRVVGYRVAPTRIKERLPVIIYNRGGTGKIGELQLAHLFGILTDFAKEGYIVYASQYAGGEDGEGADEMGGRDIDDIINLYPHIKKDPEADAKRIGMYGESNGGMKTYQVLARVRWVRAGVSIGGVSDFLRIGDFRPEFVPFMKKIFGGSQEEYLKRSALYWSEAFPKNCPVLLMHGSSDRRVNPRDTLLLAQKLLEHKKPVRAILYEGADHALTETKEDSWRETLSWFQKFLKEKALTPNLTKHGV